MLTGAQDCLQSTLAYIKFPFLRCPQVSKEVRYQSWTWVAILLLLGFTLGGATGYYLFVRDMNGVSDRLDAIQQQIALPTPDVKQGEGKSVKAKRR
jgi:hypothetical protein